MKTLKEAKIERFGHQDRYKNISTYFQITYIWEYKFLGMIFQKKETVPILFEKLKEREEWDKTQQEKERKDKEYVDSLYEVKTYKIEK